MELEYSQQIFEKPLNVQFNINPSSGRWVAPCRRTDKTNLIVCIHIFANVPIKDKTTVEFFSKQIANFAGDNKRVLKYDSRAL
jgi:hypothetical protein